MIRVALVADGPELGAAFEALHDVAELELLYLVSHGPVPERSLGGARLISSLETVLDDAAVEAVIFAGPTPQGTLEAAIRAGKALSLSRACLKERRQLEILSRALEGQSVPCFVPFPRRFDQTMGRLKSELVTGGIGRLESLSISTREPRLSPAREALADSLFEDLDLARWLLGEEPIEIHAVAGTPIDRPPEAGFDALQVSLRTRSGRLAQLSHHTRTILDLEHRVEAIGQRGGMVAISPEEDPLTLWLEDGAHRERHHARVEARAALARRAAWRHFAQAIADGSPVLTGPFDVRQVLQLGEAVLESIRSRRVIRLGR